MILKPVSSPPSTNRVGATTGTALATAGTPTRVVMLVSDHGPEYVDLGPPPRDPRGEFRDVYRNLINPLFPSKRLWGTPMHVFWCGMAAVGAFSTVGILPLMYGLSVEKRRRRYADLFRNGRATRGVIRSAKAGAMYATYKYEFEVGGMAYAAFMDYATEMTHFWSEGDQVPVLFDPEDPRRSCFVYR